MLLYCFLPPNPTGTGDTAWALLAELDAGKWDLMDDPGAPKLVFGSSVTPRSTAAWAAAYHSGDTATYGSGGDLVSNEGGELAANPARWHAHEHQ